MLRFIARKLISPSRIAEQSSDAPQVCYKTRNCELYNELFGRLPGLAIDERERIKGRPGNA
jgi:hypothetical protein